jgi:alpha-L-rhamnosidase
MQFSHAAQWIWTEGEASPRNQWYRFRRAFQCPDTIARATLLISADSRYELYINSTWLGVGPGRAYPWNYSYDVYDLTAQLQPGEENILGMLVVHWGDHTFQHIRGRGGLLCELILEPRDGTAIHIGSDDTWQVAPEGAMRTQTPRISLQQGYEEQYDASHATAI